ncbi:MAG: heme transporter HemC [Pelagibacterales bacterium MED-G40]|nr:MAG: heme transporter HemC [Pelagibacterales bacterium MED-G40]|tara:strand:- start:602 stop:1309 length:708 start_codon:yes stop_codon:yes gene_type:complete
MFNFFSPTNIFLALSKVQKFINSIFFPILIVSLVFALILSPADHIQGDAMRIMYVHVPSAWLGLACFSAITVLSISAFIFKIKNFFYINKSLAPIGLFFTFLAIVTGSLWGEPTWGTWWVWDARLTSMMVLMFFYIIYILCFKLIKKEQLLLKISSLIAILGAINLPIIKYSVDWWTTLHQPASIKFGVSNSIHSSMMLPLLSMLLVLLLYGALIFLMKYKTEIIRIKKKNIKRL